MRGNPPGLTTRSVTQPTTTAPTPQQNTEIAMGAIAILLPALLAFTVVARRHHHKRVIKQRIAELERMWKLNVYQRPR